MSDHKNGAQEPRKQTAVRDDRLPPHSIEAEQAALGACLLDPSVALQEAISAGLGDKFYDLRHQTIFNAMQEMVAHGVRVDVVSLMQWLRDRNNLEPVGGVVYLSALPDVCPSAASLDHWMGILNEKYYARQVIYSCSQLIMSAYDLPGKLDEMADMVETKIFALRNGIKSRISDRAKSFDRIVERIQEAQDGVLGMEFVPTGFPSLDAKIAMGNGEVIIIAARPSMGKSTLAMNIAENVAIDQGLPVGVFALEMDEDAMNMRSVAARGTLNMRLVMKGGMTMDEHHRLAKSIGRLKQAPIHIIADADMTINQMRAEARRMVSKHGVKLLIIDYLQLVSGSRKFENRVNEVSEVSRGIKKMAKELKVPVIALSQISREYDKDAGRKPILKDLRESGSIEQDADIVMFIYAKDEMAEVNHSLPVTVLIAKNRNGPKGEVDMVFEKAYNRFVEPKSIEEDCLKFGI